MCQVVNLYYYDNFETNKNINSIHLNSFENTAGLGVAGDDGVVIGQHGQHAAGFWGNLRNKQFLNFEMVLKIAWNFYF